MNEPRNPYAPPTAGVADPMPELTNGTLIPNGRRVPAGNGVRWMTDAFRLFFQRPWQWMGILVVFCVLWLAASVIPFSNVLESVLWPVFCGGLMFAADVERQNGSLTVGRMFAGFGPRFASLAIVGATMLISYPIMYLSMRAFVGNDIAIAFVTGATDFDPTQMMSTNFLLALLVYLLFALPIVAATYLAPALIMLHGMKPGEAMKMSFAAVFKNVLPGFVFGLVMIVVFCVSVIPLGLGLLITLPVSVITIYTMYRDVFVES
jgi:uncharacterized membrane protein